MSQFTSPVTNVVRRIAVPGIVFLLVLAANSGVFAAQCGGFPKGWKPSEVKSESAHADLADTKTPLNQLAKTSNHRAPAPASCRCEGSKCAPAAPAPLPDQRVLTGVQYDAVYEAQTGADRAALSPEFPASVNSQIRYEVVLGVFRPPCGC